jgi:predicted transcriptional regulator YdeE
MTQIDKAIKIVGISTVTSNEAAFSHNTIGKHWGEFLKIPIKDQLTDLASSSIFAVYSDYENGYNGKYKLTLGYAVQDTQTIPKGLTTVTIPAGEYKSFKSKSRAPEDIVETWKTIWKIDSKVFQPNFVTTFEEYKDTNEVIIQLGYD